MHLAAPGTIMMPLKTTVLIKEHQKCGARFIPFYGWKLPLRFTSQTAGAEHLNVRRRAGLFDISYMSKFRVKGKATLILLQKLLSNHIGALQKHQAQYNLLCNQKGGIIDDLMVYCLNSPTEYLLIGNSSQQQKVHQWIKKSLQNARLKELAQKVTVQEESWKWGMLALQGPLSHQVLSTALNTRQKIKKQHLQYIPFKGSHLIVARTGYTGEKGFELLVPVQKTPALWQEILKHGTVYGCLPAGLAARDTLRLEMKYPLYGQDLWEEIDPYSAGLSHAVKNPENFIGKEALKKQKIRQKWVGFKISTPSGLPRNGFPILAEDKPVGKVTSSVMSPSLNYIIGTGYVNVAHSGAGQKIQIKIHGQCISAEIVPTPFLKK